MNEEDVKPTILEAGTEEHEQPTNLERDLSANKEPQRPAPEAKPEKGSRGSVEKALDKIQGEEKVTEAPKPQTKEGTAPKVKDEKPEVAAPADDKGGKEQEVKPRQSEGRNYPEAPSRFLPREKELWRNAPLPVQQAVARMSQEHEAEVSQYRQSHEEYEQVRAYAERAKSEGTSLKAALDNYVGLEEKFKASPAEGFRAIMSNMNMQPYQAIGSILQAFGVPPHVAAKHMLEQSHMYAPQQPVRQSAPQQQQQQQPQSDPRIDEMRKEMDEFKANQTVENVIRPFRERLGENDRYAELEGDIVFFLKSGKIPMTLSPYERLEAAYDMAERINPSSHYRQPASQMAEPDLEQSSQRRAEPDLNGTKSVKGAPSGGKDHSPAKRYKDPRDAVKAAMNSLGM